jgi:hypothetical protein
MNDTEFDGRRIRVDKATDRRGGGGGGGGGYGISPVRFNLQILTWRQVEVEVVATTMVEVVATASSKVATVVSCRSLSSSLILTCR